MTTEKRLLSEETDSRITIRNPPERLIFRLTADEVGRLEWGDGQFRFEGDADASAEVFIDSLNHVFESRIKEAAADEIERLAARVEELEAGRSYMDVDIEALEAECQELTKKYIHAVDRRDYLVTQARNQALEEAAAEFAWPEHDNFSRFVCLTKEQVVTAIRSLIDEEERG